MITKIPETTTPNYVVTERQNKSQRVEPTNPTFPQGSQGAPQTRYYILPRIDTSTIGQHIPPGLCLAPDFGEHFAREYPNQATSRQQYQQPMAGWQDSRQTTAYNDPIASQPAQQTGLDGTGDLLARLTEMMKE